MRWTLRSAAPCLLLLILDLSAAGALQTKAPTSTMGIPTELDQYKRLSRHYENPPRLFQTKFQYWKTASTALDVLG